MEELVSLKNGLALATQAREQSDDEIIQVGREVYRQLFFLHAVIAKCVGVYVGVSFYVK